MALVLLAGCTRDRLVTRQDPGPRLSIGDLRASFDDLLDLRTVAGRCVARLPDGRLVELVGVAPDDDPVLVTPIGRVAIEDWLIVRHELARLYALVDEVPRPTAPPLLPADADAAFAHHRIDFVPLIGPVLRVGDRAWSDGSSWTIDGDESLPRRIAHVRAALDDAVAGLNHAPAGVMDTASEAFVAVASRAADERLPDDAVDELPPDAVRRLVRHGWLRDIFGTRTTERTRVDSGPWVARPGPANRRARALEEAVVGACALHVAETWSRGDSRILRIADAFGRESWFRSDTEFNELATRPPTAGFGELDWDFPDDGWVVLELDPSRDPMRPIPLEAVRGARFFENAIEIAAWRRDGGLVSDSAVWREEVPVDDLVETLAATDRYLPPHIVLTDARGDVLGLATTHGLLEPPRDASGADVDRFLADAARVLPDPAHLDLLGQYLLVYAFDGPDAARPEILGTVDLQGDRHQTAAETLATVKGGVCVGDCDDLAEIYVELLRRQERHALALGVPGHMFAASAAQTADGWAVHVLQTGLAETHRAATLTEAVVAALRSQDPTLEPDPLRIEAWPRVDDGPTRTPTWIDAGALRDAESVAHVVHHARLESRGLWAAAVDDRRADLDRLPADAGADGTENLERAARHARLAEALFETGRFEASRDHATRAALALRRPTARIGQRLAALEAALASATGADAALAALRTDLDALDVEALSLATVNTLLAIFDRLLVAADGGVSGAALAAEHVPDVMRRLRERVLGVRSDVAVEAGTWDIVDVLDSSAALAATAARLARTRADRERLLGEIRAWTAFARSRDELGMWADHSAILATLEREDPDQFVRWLGQQHTMTGAPDLSEADVDLGPWLASECMPWEWELRDRLRPGQPRPSDEMLRTLTRGLARGAVIRQAEGSFGEDDAHAQVWGKLVESTLLGDTAAGAAALRVAELWIPEHLPYLARDLGELARHAGIDAWSQTVRAWLSTGGRAKDAFLVVWAARAAGATGHALAAAELVCARFPDDPEFARERDALRGAPR